MQKYHSIADVTVKLKKVAFKKIGGGDDVGKDELKGGDGDGGGNGCLAGENVKEKVADKVMENEGNDEDGEEEEDSPDSDITDSGIIDIRLKSIRGGR